MTSGQMELQHLYQPRDKGVCGQACVAMLTSSSIDEVCEGIGNWGATKTWELVLAIRAGSKYRLRVHQPVHVEGDQDPAEFYLPEELKVEVPTALCFLRTEVERGGIFTKSHAVVRHRGVYYDPWYGQLTEEDAGRVWAADGFELWGIIPIMQEPEYRGASCGMEKCRFHP